MPDVDVAVIGAGIAGLSAAAQLAPHCNVRVLEMEATPAHHATGRSAALYIPTYGPPQVRALTLASSEWFRSNADDRAAAPLLTGRDVMFVADTAHLEDLNQLVLKVAGAGGALEVVDADAARQRCPALLPDWVQAGAYDGDASDLDVAALVDVYRHLLREGDGHIDTDHRVTDLTKNQTGWTIQTTGGDVRADLVVNAAGAWVDVVAALAGIAPLGFIPKRRTLAVSQPAPGADPGDAFVAHAAEHFYFGAESGGVVFSPSDATPSDPCDAKPEEMDIARAIDAINTATALELRSVRSAWAGLRTFSPDGGLVIGPDQNEPSFVWCGGQGGYGIQTSYAAGLATAALTLRHAFPEALSAAGLDAAALSPHRLQR